MKLLSVSLSLCLSALASAAPQTLTRVLPLPGEPLLGLPTFVTSWPGNSDILVVAERTSRTIKAFNSDAGPTTVVNLQSLAHDPTGLSDFIGVTGIAFHPQFNSNPTRRFLYVRYNAEWANSAYETRVVRYMVAPGTLIAKDASATVMYTWPTQETGHGSGTIQFDTRPVSDPVLYVPMPDDSGVSDCTNAERVQDDPDASNLGKLLSIDVNVTVPVVTVLAKGLRNPFGFSVDRGQAGTLSGRGDVWSGDVGHQTTGSILRWTPNGGFKNYGWPWYEGDPALSWTMQPVVRVTAFCGQPNNLPGTPGYLSPAEVEPPHATFSDFVVYGSGGLHDALIGGYIYRSSTVAPLTDKYVFATYGMQGPRLWSLPVAAASTTAPFDHTGSIGIGSWGPNHRIHALGQDADGELYVVRVDELAPLANNGDIFKVTP